MQLNAMMLGGFLFFSISIGGAVALLVSRLFQHTTQGLSLLCGGFLVGLLVNDILPSSLKLYDSWGIVLGVIIGYFLFLILHKSFHPTISLKPSLYLLAIAMFLHTIPLALTIGSLLEDSNFGITLTTSVILHHLPEGFALTIALLSQGEKLWKLFLCFIGFSIFFIIFVWIGHFTNLSDKGQSMLMGISIALIATTSISEFILHNIRTASMKSFLAFLLMGYLLSYVFHIML
ncbi:ZIP family metal transporter [Lysinibacillus contaminans]|uniref:ZIP family metal transporter n=1 Tax=Lysinibacillus contaminans TaxID=1293441 RepID=UPI000B2CA901|nr:zinc transporter family protein [Lysinibacillus contaminans]